MSDSNATDEEISLDDFRDSSGIYAFNLLRRLRIFKHSWLPGLVLLIWSFSTASFLIASELQDKQQCAVLELFLDKEKDNSELKKWVNQFSEERTGIQIRVHEVAQEGKPFERFDTVRKYFKQPDTALPAIYCCNYLMTDLATEAKVTKQLKSALTLRVYVRKGCGHCRAAKAYLQKVKPIYPAFKLIYHDVITNPKYINNVQQLANHYRQHTASYPVMHFCNQLMIGFQTEYSTGRKFTQKLNKWTTPCPAQKIETSWHPSENSVLWLSMGVTPFIGLVTLQETAEEEEELLIPGAPAPVEGEADDLPFLPAPPGGDELAPLDEGEEGLSSGGEQESDDKDVMEVPLLGKLNASSLGIPLFTFLIGLVDGFNPCAMWVLLFLLSLLVNLKSRAKIIAVAGSFVLVSGLVYFAFMCAWFSIYQYVGYLRNTQIALGILALLIGLIHIKDFFAFKKGVSLSIPESAKPGIYQRARKIVTAENLTGAVIGAIVLAVMVNFIELLCTLGLPAAYTHILYSQGYPSWMNYAYLALYNIAYMLDDAIMVTIVVVSLEKHKLQETGGRWLKLLSGAFIALLGLIMLFWPELLE